MPRRQSGFTLIELMTVIVVAALLLAAAIPAFTRMMNENRLSTLGNDLAATVQTMRLEAIRSGRRVIVCPTDDSATCAGDARWNGWLAFRDDDGDGVPDNGEVRQVERVREPLQLWASDAISATGSRIVLRPDGMAYDDDDELLAANLAACMAVETPAQNVRDIFVGPGGRIGVTPRDADAACGAPADP